MESPDAKGQLCTNWTVFILICALLLPIYCNTFNSSWQFDDSHNIIQNSSIHIDNLYPHILYDAVVETTAESRIFYRPAAYLSFALNWYFGQSDVTGYHVVNLIIHILTAFFLYLAVLALFKTPNLTGKYAGNEYFIAILAAVLWAVNPIQTQAVTYIVQRMAAMAAMFYILGIYLYLKARISKQWKFRLPFYCGTLFAFILAVGSKENALMFPAALLLVEMIFFTDLGNPKTRKQFIWIGSILSIALFVLGAWLFMADGFINQLQSAYAKRNFTLSERLLTEPRIILFYLTQIFYPIADRLSIVHDIEISKGLFSPWKTLPAIMLIFGLITVCFWKIRAYPLASFAVLFFFLNHVIESSIIPLELVFEHRNYLPSLFLFVPIAAGLKWAIDYYAARKKAMAYTIIAFVSILIMVLGIGTYVRNMAWANEQTLWQDALEKNPASARPYQNLASGHYAKTGDWDKVEELCKQAMDLYDSTRRKQEVISLANLASVYYHRDKDYERVIKINEQLLDIAERSKSRYHLVLSLIQNGELDRALENAKLLLSDRPKVVKYLNTIAFILIKKNEPENALRYLIKAIRINSDTAKTLLNLGFAKSMLKEYEAAEHFLRRIPVSSAHRPFALLLFIENSVKKGNTEDAKKYAEKLISIEAPQAISRKLEESNKPGLLWPVAKDLVAPVIAEELKQQSQKMSKLMNPDET